MAASISNVDRRLRINRHDVVHLDSEYLNHQNQVAIGAIVPAYTRYSGTPWVGRVAAQDRLGRRRIDEFASHWFLTGRPHGYQSCCDPCMKIHHSPLGTVETSNVCDTSIRADSRTIASPRNVMAGRYSKLQRSREARASSMFTSDSRIPPTTKNTISERIALRPEPLTSETNAKMIGPQMAENFESTE